MHFAAAALALSALFAGPAAPPPDLVTPDEKKAAAEITARRLSSHIEFLASDLLEGRAPATRGDRLALEYVATELAGMGFEPAAPEGGWIQRVPLVSITPAVPETMTISGGGKSVALQRVADFVAFPGSAKPEARLDDAELVFVGYGIVAPEFQWDDYKGADLKGKVLLMMNNDPESDPKLFAGKTRLRYGRWDYKYEIAAKQGAAGAIVIHTTPSAGYPWQVVQTSWSGSKYELPYEGEPRVQIKGWATEEAARKIAVLGGPGPRPPARLRGVAFVSPGAARRARLPRDLERDPPGRERQRHREAPGLRPGGRGRGRPLHGAPRPPGDQVRGPAGRTTRSATERWTTPPAWRRCSRSRRPTRRCRRRPAGRSTSPR